MNSTAFEVLILPACYGITLGLAVDGLLLLLIMAAEFLLDRIAGFFTEAASEPGLSHGAWHDDFVFRSARGQSWRRGGPRHEFRFEPPQETPHGRIRR